jgi:hypothetical protein
MSREIRRQIEISTKHVVHATRYVVSKGFNDHDIQTKVRLIASLSEGAAGYLILAGDLLFRGQHASGKAGHVEQIVADFFAAAPSGDTDEEDGNDQAESDVHVKSIRARIKCHDTTKSLYTPILTAKRGEVHASMAEREIYAALCLARAVVMLSVQDLIGMMPGKSKHERRGNRQRVERQNTPRATTVKKSIFVMEEDDDPETALLRTGFVNKPAERPTPSMSSIKEPRNENERPATEEDADGSDEQKPRKNQNLEAIRRNRPF